MSIKINPGTPYEITVDKYTTLDGQHEEVNTAGGAAVEYVEGGSGQTANTLYWKLKRGVSSVIENIKTSLKGATIGKADTWIENNKEALLVACGTLLIFNLFFRRKSA